jgi:hypothetical protein
MIAAGTVFGWTMAMIPAAGCGSQGQAGGRGVFSPGPTEAVAVGDWNDVQASLAVAVGENETAIVSNPESTPTVQRFELKTILDERGEFIARRDAPGPDNSPGPVHLSVSIGHFGNAKTERGIMASFRRRFGDLAGVDYRPLR